MFAATIAVGEEGDELDLFLSKTASSKYRKVLDEEDIDIEALLEMDDTDLKEIGILKGPRVRILKNLQKRKEQQKASGQDTRAIFEEQDLYFDQDYNEQDYTEEDEIADALFVDLDLDRSGSLNLTEFMLGAKASAFNRIVPTQTAFTSLTESDATCSNESSATCAAIGSHPYLPAYLFTRNSWHDPDLPVTEVATVIKSYLLGGMFAVLEN